MPDPDFTPMQEPQNNQPQQPVEPAAQPQPPQQPINTQPIGSSGAKLGKKKLMLIIIAAVMVLFLVGGGWLGYQAISDGNDNGLVGTTNTVTQDYPSDDSDSGSEVNVVKEVGPFSVKLEVAEILASHPEVELESNEEVFHVRIVATNNSSKEQSQEWWKGTLESEKTFGWFYDYGDYEFGPVKPGATQVLDLYYATEKDDVKEAYVVETNQSLGLAGDRAEFQLNL